MMFAVIVFAKLHNFVNLIDYITRNETSLLCSFNLRYVAFRLTLGHTSTFIPPPHLHSGTNGDGGGGGGGGGVMDRPL